MPVKNASPWLAECIESILDQEVKNWQLIAVDDHSTDDSESILKNYAQKDSRIQVFVNEGQGIISALQTAYRESSGGFVTRMDADDVMPSLKLERLLKLAQQQPYGIATGMVKYFANQPITKGYLAYENWLNERCKKNDYWNWIYRECVIASANWMAHRSLIQFDQNVYPEDYDLVFDWYSKNLPVYGCQEITHFWREHSERTSRKSKHYNQKSFFELKINRFIEIDLKSDQALIVLGKTRKSKLVVKTLNQKGIKHYNFGKEEVKDVARFDKPQLLLAFYPPFKNRLLIESNLGQMSLKKGKNFWWL